MSAVSSEALVPQELESLCSSINLIGHCFSLAGTFELNYLGQKPVNVELEYGAVCDFISQASANLSEYFNQQEQNKLLNSLERIALSKTMSVLENTRTALEKNSEKFINILKAGFKENGICYIPGGWPGHILALVISDATQGNFYIGNKGEGVKLPGIGIYTCNLPYTEFFNDDFLCKISSHIFIKKLFIGKLQKKYNLEFEALIKTKRQKVNNCAYVSLKLALLAIMHSALVQTNIEPSKADILAKSFYKKFVHFDRIKNLELLFKTIKNHEFKFNWISLLLEIIIGQHNPNNVNDIECAKHILRFIDVHSNSDIVRLMYYKLRTNKYSEKFCREVIAFILQVKLQLGSKKINISFDNKIPPTKTCRLSASPLTYRVSNERQAIPVIAGKKQIKRTGLKASSK